MATNEELAVLIQGGAEEHIPQLWEQVRLYVEMKASRYAANMPSQWADGDDLERVGYFAMLAAIQDYEADRGANFLTCLTWALQKEFAAVVGVRTSRRDAAQYADSLDAPMTRRPGRFTTCWPIAAPRSRFWCWRREIIPLRLVAQS